MKKTGGHLESFGEDEEVLVYHYGKPGERLKNAPENVKEYYEGKGAQPPKGFFKSLVQTKSNRIIFVILLTVIAISAVTMFLQGDSGSGVIAKLPVELSAFSFEETVYSSLRISEKPISDAVLVSVVFNAYDENKNLVFSEISQDFYNGKEVFLRTKFTDYDIIYIEAEIKIAEDTILLRCNVKET